MNRRSLTTTIAAALSVVLFSGAGGHAAEIKVLTSVALTSSLNELVPAFEKKTGDKVVIEYGLAAEQKKRVLAGERADVIILTRAMMEDLAKQGKVAADSIANVAGTPVSVVARAGAAKPDVSSVEAFKQALDIWVWYVEAVQIEPPSDLRELSRELAAQVTQIGQFVFVMAQ